MIDNDIMWMDAAGNIQLLSATLNYGNMSSINVSQQAFMRPFIEEKLNLSKLKKVMGTYYSMKRQLHWAAPTAGVLFNRARLVVDLMRPDKPRFRYSDRDICPSIWMRLDTDLVARPVTGDNTGTVWLMDQSLRSKGTTAYTGLFQTPHLDLAYIDPVLATKRKIGKFIELVMDSVTESVTVDVVWDGKVTQTIVFDGSSDVLLDDFMLDDDFLSESGIIIRRKRITGSGHRISLVVYNSNLDETFSIARAYLYFTVGNERI
jgi:hypothetical protein